MTSEGSRRVLGHRSTNRVVDGVDAVSVCYLPQPARQVAVSIVDGLVRTQATAKLSAGLVAHDRDHPGPKGPAELHCSDPAATCRSEHGYPLAPFETSAVDQADPCGEVGYPEAGGVDRAQAGWNGEGPLRGSQIFLGERTVAVHEAGGRHDSRPEGHVDVRTHGTDDAGNLLPRRESTRRRER